MSQKNKLQYIILGLLARQDLTGYDIKKLFEGEVGDFWRSNHSQVYPELRKMAGKGLITAYTATVGTKMEKTYYKIAPPGKDLLTAWMHEPLGDLVPSRDDFTMKLYLIDDPRDPLIAQLFAEEIARHTVKLAYLEQRWQELFASSEKQQQHYGHALILTLARNREHDYLTWLKAHQPKEK